MNIIIITQSRRDICASPMAAMALKEACVERHWQASVEVQCGIDSAQRVAKDQIQRAELILVATENSIDLTRFVGKSLYQGSLNDALNDPRGWLSSARQKAKIVAATSVNVTDATVATAPPVTLKKNIVAVTACPTGVAHTFMSAEALKTAAEKSGHQIKVETRGSVGSENTLTQAEIEQADLVILAVDIDVDTEAFFDKPVYRTSTGKALKKPEETIETAIATAHVESHRSSDNAATHGEFNKEKTGAYKHLMTGVSFMLPVVVAGGLIIALSLAFGIDASKQPGSLAAALMTIGSQSAFALMLPILAGYIAYSIAERPGLAPGLIGGMLASSLMTGFLGAILAGFLAGYCSKNLVAYIKLPQSFSALKPILIVPLLATLITGLVMIYIVGTPVAAINQAMTDFLQSMNSGNAVLLGIILGAMMCFDLGGPVNKAAYTFGVGLLAGGTYAPMAAIVAAGMVPAIGMGIATFFGKKYFNEQQHEAGKASFCLGLCFITEGAIPFAAADPFRVIPVCMTGGALTGGLCMIFGAQLLAPHGGLFVLLIPNALSPIFPYLFAITIGSLVTGFGYLLVKPKSVYAPVNSGA
jgi:fructose PTS system EIIBC or EIIC component